MRSTDHMDPYTAELFDELFSGSSEKITQTSVKEIRKAVDQIKDNTNETGPIVSLFLKLIDARHEQNASPTHFGLGREMLQELALRHSRIDEHGVTIGGRVGRALGIVEDANDRVREYLQKRDDIAPSGLLLWEEIQDNIRRIMSVLGMTEKDFHSYSGQLKFVIDTVATLSRVLDLPKDVLQDVTRVTKDYRMRMTPYYASLIRQNRANDPILIQAVPTGEMIDNAGTEVPPVAADHSPSRLVDQFYPRTLTVKATNMCAMYCTHCLRIAHIGKKDRIYEAKAYDEALAYIRANRRIRDVLITGGDALALSNRMIRRLLKELDQIDHVEVKRLGTRIPVTVPMRIDSELIDILADSNELKPLRVVTQINTAQEITPLSKEAFRRISKASAAVLNQAVLLKGVNDTKIKMWQLCETIHSAYVRPYYVFNCSYRNPQFSHLRVPVETGRDIIESMYGNISGDAIPRYIATAGGKIPLHRSNVIGRENNHLILKKPWNGETVVYPDADEKVYNEQKFSFTRHR